MYTFLLVIHMLIAISLIGIVLLQRSEGGALGIGGSLSGMMTARGTTNLLTRTTIILATCFMIMSIILAFFSDRYTPRSIIDTIVPEEQDIIDVPIDSPDVPSTNIPADSPDVPSTNVPADSADESSTDETDGSADESSTNETDGSAGRPIDE